MTVSYVGTTVSAAETESKMELGSSATKRHFKSQECLVIASGVGLL